MTGRLLYRVASDPAVGLGHVARARALGRALAGAVPVHWILDPVGPAPVPGAPAEREAESGGCAVLATGSRDPDVIGVIADAYRADRAALAALAARVPCFVLEDEGADLPPPLRVVTPGYPPAGIDPAARIVGPRYALIDPIFCVPPRRPGAGIGSPSILVQFGGRDQANASERALAALRPLRRRFAAVTVLLGPQARHLDRLRCRVGAFYATLVAGAPPAAVAALYRAHDVAVGGGGVALFERMAAGLPSLILTQSANQRANAVGAARDGAVHWIGEVESTPAALIRAEMQKLLVQREARLRMTAAGRRIADGRGAARLAAQILRAIAADAPAGNAALRTQ